MLELRARPRANGRRLHFVQLGYCAEHRGEVTITELLSDEGFDKIAKTAREAGKERLDHRATTLAWHPMTKRELYFLRRSQHNTSKPVVDEDAELAF